MTTIEKLSETNKTASNDNILVEFNLLSKEEQKTLLSQLLNLASEPKNTNKAVTIPNGASVKKRKLKPGVDFATWYKGWLPPVTPKNISHYFPVPTRVINLRPIDDEENFLTIGFVNSPFDSIDELLNARSEDLKNSEQQRRNINDNMLAESSNTFYYVASDDVFGS